VRLSVSEQKRQDEITFDPNLLHDGSSNVPKEVGATSSEGFLVFFDAVGNIYFFDIYFILNYFTRADGFAVCVCESYRSLEQWTDRMTAAESAGMMRPDEPRARC